MHVIQQQVQAVHRRQQRQWLWQCASAGLLCGGATGSLIAAVRVAAGGSFSWIWIALAMLIPLAIGVGWSFLTARTLQSAASTLDQACRLKDGTQSSLEFLKRSSVEPLHRLQIEETERHLRSVDPDQVAPVTAPRMWTWGILTSVSAILLAIQSTPNATVLAAPVANAVIIAQAQRAIEGLEELEQFQENHHDPELEKLLKEMNEHLEQLSEPGVAPKEALAKLSEMEAALQDMQRQLSDPVTEAQMSEVGRALSLSDPMKPAGEAMANGDLKAAAEEVAKLELPPLDRRTQTAVVEKLEQAKQNAANPVGRKDLQESLDKMVKGLKASNEGTFEEGAKGLARELKQQDQKKTLSDLLKKQSLNLLECKSQCENESRNAVQGNRKGGTKAGKGSGGDPTGDMTAMNQTGKELKLTGQDSSEGEIERETISSPEQKPEPEAVREYRSQSQKFEALSESVLESESIPLGHRQTIRRYFELIRPQDSETDAVLQKSAPAVAP